MDVDIDLSNRQFGRGVPFEAFAELRRQAPLFWYEPDQFWVVSTYDLLGEINRNPADFSSSGGPTGPAASGEQPLQPIVAQMLIQMDPPRHTANRRLVSTSFTPRAINARGATVRALAAELIDKFVSAGGGDWVEEVATLLPLRVISEMLGMPREDEGAILARARAHTRVANGDRSIDAAQLLADNIAYADWLIDDHRRNPRGDLVDQLLNARLDGQELSREELRAWITMYIGGGVDTTRHLIAHGLVALLEHPDARRHVVSGCDMATVVEEMLRYVSPVMQHSRWPVRDVDVRGTVIRRGQRTTLWMISANRDEAAFEHPDRFDVHREPNRHDSLGAGGPHFCLGAGLARLEAQLIFEEVRPYLDRFSLNGVPTRGENNFFNVLTSCPVSVA